MGTAVQRGGGFGRTSRSCGPQLEPRKPHRAVGPQCPPSALRRPCVWAAVSGWHMPPGSRPACRSRSPPPPHECCGPVAGLSGSWVQDSPTIYRHSREKSTRASESAGATAQAVSDLRSLRCFNTYRRGVAATDFRRSRNSAEDCAWPHTVDEALVSDGAGAGAGCLRTSESQSNHTSTCTRCMHPPNATLISLP
jgi:hypothetical protein